MLSITEILETMDYGPSPESTGIAQTWLAARQNRFGLYMNGMWKASENQFETRNPANGKVLAEVAQANAHDVD